MRRTIILFFIILTFGQLFGQRGQTKWFEASITAEYGNSDILNYNIIYDDNISMFYYNNSFSYGGRIGVSFGQDYSLTLEGLSHVFNQRFHITPEKQATYIKRVKINAMEFTPLFRYTSFAGFYFELGPRFMMINQVDDFNSMPYTIKSNPDSLYNKGMLKSIVGGLGFILYSSYDDRMRVTFGLRAAYTFDDIMANSTHPMVQDSLYYPNYKNQHSTEVFTIHAKVEFTYFFGYYGRAGCGKHRFVFFK
jgi:hypothetical protein